MKTVTQKTVAEWTDTPLISVGGNGTPTIEIKTGSTADGGVVGAWQAVSGKLEGVRYVQIRVTMDDATAPRIDTLTIIFDGTVIVDRYNDVNTAIASDSWFERIATGHFKIASRSGNIAAISQATISALQNVGAGYTAEVISKTADISGIPAAEFKIYNASNVWVWFVETGLSYYCGLSGVLNCLFVIAVFLLWQDTRNPILPIIFIGAFAKIILEIYTHDSILTSISWASLPTAHLVGFITGAFLVTWFPPTLFFFHYLSCIYPKLKSFLSFDRSGEAVIFSLTAAWYTPLMAGSIVKPNDKVTAIRYMAHPCRYANILCELLKPAIHHR